MGSGAVRVAIKELSPGYSPRVQGEDTEHIRILATTEDDLPAIVVHRPTMRVVDGMHRMRAAIERGESEILVEYFDGSEEDAFVRAVRDNLRHGPVGERGWEPTPCGPVGQQIGDWVGAQTPNANCSAISTMA